MGSIVRRGNSWRAIIRRKSVGTLTKTFSKQALAKLWISRTEDSIERREVFAKGHTVGTVIDKYRVDIVEKRPYKTKTPAHLKRLARELAQDDLADCTPEWWLQTVQDWTCSPQSRTRYLGLITSALKTGEALWGVSVDWISYRRGKALMGQLGITGNGKRRTRRLRPGEYGLLCKHFSSEFPMQDILDFQLLTALRASELCRIRWADLDKDRKMVLVRDRKHPFKKIGNHWNIPLFGNALDIIERQELTTSDFIFPFIAESVEKAFARARDAAKIVDLTFHDIRHEAISRLFEMGYGIPEVALVSGHSDWGSLKIYTQLNPESLHKGPLSRSTPG
jgi:integrase